MIFITSFQSFCLAGDYFMRVKNRVGLKTSRILNAIFLFGVVSLMAKGLEAVLIVEGELPFQSHVINEIQLMRDGKRGVVSQSLIHKLDSCTSTTTIRSITGDEETWHPNDRKGTRSFVVPVDNKIRGSQRTVPTNAIVYIHPHRVDPGLSLFRLGTFAYELSFAADLNRGEFSGNNTVREKRATFFRNAWCDANGYNLIELSGRIQTKEFQKAKAAKLITVDYFDSFPILDLDTILNQ